MGNSIECGVCPNCGSDMLDYEELRQDGDMIYYPWKCEHCGSTGKEWYATSFCGHDLHTEDGSEYHEASY